MKRLFTFGIVALFALMPLVSSARTVVADEELAGVTAEAGVTIVFTDVIADNTTLTSVAWGDTNGFTGYTGSGWVGINGISIASAGANQTASLSGAMNIDVGSSGTLTNLKIDLPTVKMGQADVQANMRISNVPDLSVGDDLCFIRADDLLVELNGSIQIRAH
jgi:hypothetical protein